MSFTWRHAATSASRRRRHSTRRRVQPAVGLRMTREPPAPAGMPGRALLALRCQAHSQRRLHSCIGIFYELVDLPGVFSVPLKDRVRVSDCVSHPRVVREQHGSSIGWIVSRWSFEGDESIADLVAVHPRPEAQFVVSADAWFADSRERVLPSSEQLVVLSTNEVWPDVHVVDEAKPVATPDAPCLRGIRVEA
jgi:hypothetical protein